MSPMVSALSQLIWELEVFHTASLWILPALLSGLAIPCLSLSRKELTNSSLARILSKMREVLKKMTKVLLWVR